MRTLILCFVILSIFGCVFSNFENNYIKDDSFKEEITSIKVRVTTNDRELCSVVNLQHPFYPKCQDYCEKLGHWIGMCRRKQFCYCYK